MPSLIIIYVAALGPLKLCVHIYPNANQWDIFFVRQKFIHGRPGPFCFSCRREDAFYEEHINDFAQAGSGKISVKDTADYIRLFFMYCDFSFVTVKTGSGWTDMGQ